MRSATIQFAEHLAIAASVIGLCGMLGWRFDIPILTTYIDHTVTMKMGTSAMLFFQGVSTFAIVRTYDDPNHEGDTLIIPMCAMSILAITLAASGHMPYSDPLSLDTVRPGLPSVATFLMASTFVGIDVGYLFRVPGWRRYAASLSKLILALCSLALLAHLLYQATSYPPFQWLYYYIPPWSTGLAIPTAIGGVMLAEAHLILTRRHMGGV